ncbi:caskin-1-like [Limulus polyphemus]|uniref:Caskin-1-like n=1 Tax=Limulus polyphemus TaxID=6850 RepID=A0ABM1SH44_LIMPO|nr:caskin-1-like [Limulus polyphemus]
MLSAMTKEHELFHAIKSEDIPALSRILVKYKTSKHKLLGSNKRSSINIQDPDGSVLMMCSTLLVRFPEISFIIQINQRGNKIFTHMTSL